MEYFHGGVMMRYLSLILPASLLVLASSAGAQSQYHLSTQSGATSEVQVIAQAQPFQFYDYEAEAISGGYAMANGWRLKVDPSSNGIVARIDKGHPIKLTAVSRDKYVTSDGNMWMEFNRGRGDDMVMSYVPDTGTAQVVVVGATSTLAQR
jgi:hypothetical protein